MKDFILQNDGLGLAAPQVGILKNFFIFLSSPGHFIVAFNPIIEILTSETIEFYERCFSCPGVVKVTHRPRKIKLHFNDSLWNRKAKIYEDTVATVIQHEFDHLSGKLISDVDFIGDL